MTDHTETTYSHFWCNECGDSWQAERVYREGYVPVCHVCGSEDTETFGEPE